VGAVFILLQVHAHSPGHWRQPRRPHCGLAL
jgi:hypothetical protein